MYKKGEYEEKKVQRHKEANTRNERRSDLSTDERPLEKKLPAQTEQKKLPAHAHGRAPFVKTALFQNLNLKLEFLLFLRLRIILKQL